MRALRHVITLMYTLLITYKIIILLIIMSIKSDNISIVISDNYDHYKGHILILLIATGY